jgi:hypothetical protein
MYAEARVKERLRLAEDELRMPLTYHSVSQVEEFESRLRESAKYTYNESGKPNGTLNLTTEEAQWMSNEQALCVCDAAYFLTRYAFLRDEEGIIKRFSFRVPQRLYFDIICDLEAMAVAIEILALKARQLGVSIFSELLISHRSIFSYGANAIIGSADQTKTSEMSRMMFLCYDMLPVWLRPQHTSRVESDRGKILFGDTVSGISFQHGSRVRRARIHRTRRQGLVGGHVALLQEELAALPHVPHVSPVVLRRGHLSQARMAQDASDTVRLATKTGHAAARCQIGTIRALHATPEQAPRSLPAPH